MLELLLLLVICIAALWIGFIVTVHRLEADSASGTLCRIESRLCDIKDQLRPKDVEKQPSPPTVDPKPKRKPRKKS